MSNPTIEELLNMRGGASAENIGSGEVGAFQIQPAVPASVVEENIKNTQINKDLMKDLNSFAMDTLEGDKPTGAPKMQYSDELGVTRPRQQRLHEEQVAPRGNTPYKRFQAFVKFEESQNSEFNFADDVYDMVDYMIEKEKLAKRFGKFTSEAEETFEDEDEEYDY
jgi:hypothetical protein